jgi:hypothetical protein
MKKEKGTNAIASTGVQRQLQCLEELHNCKLIQTIADSTVCAAFI